VAGIPKMMQVEYSFCAQDCLKMHLPFALPDGKSSTIATGCNKLSRRVLARFDLVVQTFSSGR
jgi:hypothetical protein